MKQVSKEYFYEYIAKLDVCITLIGNFPYTSLFKLRNGTFIGKVVQSYTDNEQNKYPIVKDFYIYD